MRAARTDAPKAFAAEQDASSFLLTRKLEEGQAANDGSSGVRKRATGRGKPWAPLRGPSGGGGGAGGDRQHSFQSRCLGNRIESAKAMLEGSLETLAH